MACFGPRFTSTAALSPDVPSRLAIAAAKRSPSQWKDFPTSESVKHVVGGDEYVQPHLGAGRDENRTSTAPAPDEVDPLGVKPL